MGAGRARRGGPRAKGFCCVLFKQEETEGTERHAAGGGERGRTVEVERARGRSPRRRGGRGEEMGGGRRGRGRRLLRWGMTRAPAFALRGRSESGGCARRLRSLGGAEHHDRQSAWVAQNRWRRGVIPRSCVVPERRGAFPAGLSLRGKDIMRGVEPGNGAGTLRQRGYAKDSSTCCCRLGGWWHLSDLGTSLATVRTLCFVPVRKNCYGMG